ncbi:MAG TPA: hypothetical protein VGG75_42585 [Trebonia sp.]|jgi:hypothetical protein
MRKTHPAAWQERDERAHAIVQDAVDKGYEDSGAKYHVPNLKNHDTANETRKIVARALEHFGYPRAAWVTDKDGTPCYRGCKDPDAPHGVGFQLHSKTKARAYVVGTTGGDPSKLKWNPHSRRRYRRPNAN